MVGWRARVGLILPADNAVIEPEYAGLGLVGISYHAARITTTDRSRMPTEGIDLSEVFSTLVVDAVGYACMETSSLAGADQNTRIAREMEARTGIPAITAASAMTAAIRAVGAARIALVTPYGETAAHAVADLFDRDDVAVVSTMNHPFQPASPQEPEWYQTNLQPPAVAYRLGHRAVTSDCDAVVICSTNLRTFEVIDALERDCGRPVISTNSALLWWLLRAAGVRVGLPSLGALHRVESMATCD